MAVVEPTSPVRLEVINQFIITGFFVAAARAHAVGMDWLENLCESAARDLPVRLPEDQYLDKNTHVEAEYEDSRTGLAYLILDQEILYMCHRFSPLVPNEMQSLDIPKLADRYGQATNDFMSEEAVSDLETVHGSITSLLDRLPKWMRKVAEVMMEVIKITHGG